MPLRRSPIDSPHKQLLLQRTLHPPRTSNRMLPPFTALQPRPTNTFHAPLKLVVDGAKGGERAVACDAFASASSARWKESAATEIQIMLHTALFEFLAARKADPAPVLEAAADGVLGRAAGLVGCVGGWDATEAVVVGGGVSNHEGM
jgi:hypothetical protein